jgi:hypothetical protein
MFESLLHAVTKIGVLALRKAQLNRAWSGSKWVGKMAGWLLRVCWSGTDVPIGRKCVGNGGSECFMVVSWPNAYFLLSLTSVKHASCLMRIRCLRESIAQRERANSSSAVILDDAGYLQKSVAPGTLPSQGQHSRTVDTSGLLHARDFPLLCMGRSLVGLTIVAT